MALRRFIGIRFFEDDDGIGIGDFGTIMAKNRVEAYRFFERLHAPDIPAIFSEKEITELHGLIERDVLNVPMEDVSLSCENIEDTEPKKLAEKVFAGKCRILLKHSYIEGAAVERGGEVVPKEEKVSSYEDGRISFDCLDRGSSIDEIDIATVKGTDDTGSLPSFTEFLTDIAAVIRKDSQT